MKKIMFMVAACAAMVACNNNGKTATEANTADSTKQEVAAADSMVYEGVVPAADAFGIKYRVALAQDSTMGYSLTEAYMKSETEVDTANTYKGTVATREKEGKQDKYYEFATAKDDKVTFKVLNDSTLRMVNSDLEEAVAKEGMNYDLKLKK